VSAVLSRRRFLECAGAVGAVLALPKHLSAQEVQSVSRGMPSSWLTLESFGARGDGETPDDSAFESLLNSVGDDRSAVIYLPQRYRLEKPVRINGKSLALVGNANSGVGWTGFTFGGDGALNFERCAGCNIEKIGFRAQPGYTPEHDMVSLVDSSLATFDNVGFDGAQADGVRYLRATGSSNATRFINLRARGANGSYGFFFGGPMPSTPRTGANIIDFSVFSIGARDNCDAIVFDGSSGSARFTNGAFNFGRRGIWGKSVGFLYFNACGWENHEADYTLDFERASTVSIVGCYIQGGLRCSEAASSFRIGYNQIRAGRFNGIDIGGMQMLVSGNSISRNGIADRFQSSGIKIRDTAKNVNITGNTIARDWTWNRDTDQQTRQNGLQRFAIENDAPLSAGVLISDNLISEYSEAPIGGSVPSGPNIRNNTTF